MIEITLTSTLLFKKKSGQPTSLRHKERLLYRTDCCSYSVYLGQLTLETVDSYWTECLRLFGHPFHLHSDSPETQFFLIRFYYNVSSRSYCFAWNTLCVCGGIEREHTIPALKNWLINQFPKRNLLMKLCLDFEEERKY